MFNNPTGAAAINKRKAYDNLDNNNNHDEISEEELYVPLKIRKQQLQQAVKQNLGIQDAPKEEVKEAQGASNPSSTGIMSSMIESNPVPNSSQSLLDISFQIQKTVDPEKAAAEKRAAEEAAILSNLQSSAAPLMGLKQAATGVNFTELMKTNWFPCRKVQSLSEDEIKVIRGKYHIITELKQGDTPCPAPCTRFNYLNLPKSILKALKDKGINKPTPIQIQGLPAILSGRDIIGIAFTGSGKTLVFTLPMLLFGLRAEIKCPLRQGEGPISMVICPGRELAQQTYEIAQYFAGYLAKDGFPKLNVVLAIGGIDFKQQVEALRAQGGVHCLIGTPGRVLDLLEKKKFSLDLCKYIALDEADRLFDQGFEETVRNLFDYFTFQRQTVLFSATMPRKIQEFALSALVQPLVVNVGKAGAANMNVVQRVEYVKQPDKLQFLLDSLQLTAPPVLIFAQNQVEVDDIYEFLLRKAVDCVAIHAGKSQVDRLAAVEQFRTGKKDILVATDVASKGLDFPAIAHVINYDMPPEIEDYVHRIGRTGRKGNTGLATTFVNRDARETTLLDLKQILKIAKQEIPPFLASLPDLDEGSTLSGAGCSICGGFAHSALNCPKLRHLNKQKGNDQFGYDVPEDNM
jgi:ATP-dependent RNA helicase DDX41